MTATHSNPTFIVTTVGVLLAIALLWVAGCGSTVVENCQDGDCAPKCPRAIPQADTACAVADQLCKYHLDGCTDVEASCVDGNWRSKEISLGPCDPQQCPDALPVEGASCGHPEGTVCSYPASALDCTAGYDDATCKGGTWTIEYALCN